LPSDAQAVHAYRKKKNVYSTPVRKVQGKERKVERETFHPHRAFFYAGVLATPLTQTEKEKTSASPLMQNASKLKPAQVPAHSH